MYWHITMGRGPLVLYSQLQAFPYAYNIGTRYEKISISDVDQLIANNRQLMPFIKLNAWMAGGLIAYQNYVIHDIFISHYPPHTVIANTCSWFQLNTRRP